MVHIYKIKNFHRVSIGGNIKKFSTGRNDWVSSLNVNVTLQKEARNNNSTTQMVQNDWLKY